MPKRVKEPDKLRERKNRKQRCIESWEILDKLGVLQKEAAYKIGVHRAYFNKVINNQEEASVLSLEKLKRLELYVGEKIIELINKVFCLGLAHVDIISTVYKASDVFTSKEEKIIKESVANSIASLLAGRPEPAALPSGVLAASGMIDGGRHCEIHVILTKRNGKDAFQARIHEYDHYANYFKDKANDLRGSSKKPELPKQGF